MVSKRAVMKCWVCARQARGFGHADIRFSVGRAARYPVDWVFCSQRCQRCFHKLYEAGVRLLSRGDARTSVKEGDVIDPSEAEMAAMRRCLKPLGEAANEVGMDRALSTYSKEEACPRDRLLASVRCARTVSIVKPVGRQSIHRTGF